MVSFLGRHSRLFLGLSFVLATCQPATAGKEYLPGPKDHIAAGQLLVNVRPGADIRQVLNGIAPQAAATRLTRLPNTYLINFPAGNQAAISRFLAAHPEVNYVEPNRIRSINVGQPNDPQIVQQWALTNIHASQAWSYFPDGYLTAATASSSRVKVAVLDTGVDCTHPDFMNAGGTSTDAAQGGQILWASSQVIQPTTISPYTCGFQDDNGHGTHTAGIVAAATNNSTGVASLGFPLQLIIIKTCDKNGNATDYQVAEGIIAGVNQGAQVISMSLGGEGYSQTMQSAMDYAWQRNVLVVAAAGNSGDSQLIYPGDGNHVLGVAATDSNNAAANFSSYGNWVRIAAPGVGVLSTLPTYGSGDGTNYGALSGTSMATPHVAALGGLIYAANPGINVQEVVQRIEHTAQSPNSGWDQHIGWGVINAGAALANTPGSFTQGAITGQVTDTSGNALNTSAVVTVTGGASFTTDYTQLFRFNLNPGTYTVSVAASGYSTVSVQAVVVAGADTMLSVVMGQSLGEFSGTVTHNGVGIAGASVQGYFGGIVYSTAVTDLSGNYTLFVPPSTYTLTASAPNYLSTTSSSQTVTTNGNVTVNLALTAMGNITGTVTDLNGIPVAGAQIDFASSSFTGGTVANASGAYSTYGLAAGTYTVTASAPGYTSVSLASVTVTNNVSTLANLQFATGVALSNGLIGYWPFNDGSGGTAHDLSGNHYDANLVNTTWTSGYLFPSAMTFNVSSSYAYTPAIPFNGPLSASVWVNPTSSAGWTSLMQTNTGPGWWLGIDASATQYKLIVNSGTGSSGSCAVVYISGGCAQGGAIATGWHMVTATYDGVTGILYVDGVKVASDTFTTTSFSSVVSFGVNWGGAMQSFRMYNRALTASEVSSLYNLAPNLGLTKTADSALVAGGAPIGYTLTATNSGTGSATSATITDVLPTGTGVSWSISPSYSGQGTCAIVSGTLTCNLGTLSTGGSASVHVTGSTTNSSCGSYPNTATLSASNAGSIQASASAGVTCTQSIAFGALTNSAFGSAPFTVSASSTSGLPVSFNSSTTSSVCTVSGSTVTLIAGGTCTVTATQAGNTYYSAAPPVSQSFTVTPAAQSIAFGALPNKAYGLPPFTVSATATSGLAVSFNSSTTSSICSVSGTTVTLAAGGTCTVTATQAGNTNYAAATPVSQSFTVTAATQSIAFGTLASKPFGSAPFTVSATATSGLTVTFDSSTTTSVCTVSVTTVTLIAGGTCTVTASQAGNSNYSAATPVSQSFTVTATTQSIAFGTLASKPFVSGALTVSATATSGLTVTFDSSTTTSVCTVSGTTVTLIAGGTCTVTASQAGNTSYAAATPVSQSFTVTPATQSITFGALANKPFGSAPFAVSATATSGLAASYNSSTTSSVCTVSGSTVTLVAGGTCTVTATQSGNASYSAATPVSQSFTVTPTTQSITFGALLGKAFGSAPFGVSATATSGLAVTFDSSTTTSVCTVSGSTVTLVAAGTCTVTASQSGSASYSAATPVSQSFTVTPAAQTITFGALGNKVYGTAPFTVSATATSGLAVTFDSSTTTSVCTVSGTTVTLLAGGICVVTASQGGNSNYAAAAPVSQSFAVTSTTQTITFGPLTGKTYGSAPFAVSATATSGLPVSFNSSTTLSVCTVSGSMVTLVAAGTCTVNATQSGNATYAAATPVSQSFTVTPQSQSITFGALAGKAFGSAPFAVSATATSSLTVTFDSSTTLSVCTVSGTTVTLIGGGACTITASQAGNSNFSAATPVSQSFTVTPQTQSITFGALAGKAYGSTPFSVSATSTSGLAVGFNSSTTSSVCTVSGSTVTLVAGGTCTVTATQSGNASYSAAAPVSQSFTVTPATQSITFGTLPSKAFGSAPFTVSATATSGLPVTFDSSTTSSVCTISGSTVTLIAGGTCTITATQSGNATYAAAAPVSQSFLVTSTNQSITFNALANQIYGTAPFALTATATSNLPVTFTSQTTNVCTVATSTVTLIAGGTCTITATQSGNATYAAAAPVSQSFLVTSTNQSITFNALANQIYGTAPFALTATATSNLPVTFTSQTTNACTISGSTVTLIAGGTCTITATQSGNATYTAAAPVSQSFLVTSTNQSITFNALANQIYGTAPFALTATATSNLPVTFTSQTTNVCTVATSTVTLIAGGTCTITATQSGNATYTAAAPVSQSFLVTSTNQSITFNALANQIYGTAPFALTATASSNLPVTFTSQTTNYGNDASNTLTMIAGVTSTITAKQSGNATYTAAAPVSQSFLVTSTNQTITFNALANQVYGTAPFALTATATSNLPVTFTSQTTNVCTVATSTVTLIAGGTCTITATQSGNATYAAAAPVSQSFLVTPGTAASISVSSGSGQSASVGMPFPALFSALVRDAGGNAVANTSVTFTAPSSGAAGTFSNSSTTYTGLTNVSGIATALVFTGNATAGSYSVTATAAGIVGAASFSLTNVAASSLTLTESTTTFIQGQTASYTVTIANAAGAGPTSGAVTVTISIPTGLTLTALNGGSAWICAVPTASCTTTGALSAGSSSQILVSMNVAANAQGPISIGASLSAESSQTTRASYNTPIVSSCAVTMDSSATVTDVQQIANEALGTSSPLHDMNGDGRINLIDLQIVLNAALQKGCSAN